MYVIQVFPTVKTNWKRSVVVRFLCYVLLHLLDDFSDDVVSISRFRLPKLNITNTNQVRQRRDLLNSWSVPHNLPIGVLSYQLQHSSDELM